MKKVIFCALFALLFSNITVNAQQDTVHMLIKPSKINYLGLYVAPEMQFGQTYDEFKPFVAHSFMLMFNKRFAIGATGSMSTDRAFSPTGISPLQLRTAFGGAKMEYTFKPNSTFHISLPLVVGMGMARADSAGVRGHGFGGHHDDDNDGTTYDRGGLRGEYFVVQPGLNLEANLFRYGKIFVGANYRFAGLTSSETNALPVKTLQGASFSAGVKLGLFDYRIKRKDKSAAKN